MKKIAVIITLINLMLFSQKAMALAEFGTLHSSDPGTVVITVDDGNPIKRYCIIELTVNDKKIKWISHPLSEAFVKRTPKFIYNFNDKKLLIGSTGKDKKDNTNAQLHIYTKEEQTLDMIAGTPCTDRAEITVENKFAKFSCADKLKTVKFKTSISDKVGVPFPPEAIKFVDRVFESKNDDWRFEIAETDDYFKDRLLIVEKNQVLKEYKAKDFMRCFEYETLKGSQNKFSE